MGTEDEATMADVDTQAEPCKAAAGKRAAEGPAEGEPPSKQPTVTANDEDKSEADISKAEDAEPVVGDDAEEAKEEPNDEEKDKMKNVFPLQLGPRTFDSLENCLAYFRRLLKAWPENVPVNEYEHLVLSDLLKTCHPRPRSKIGPGVVAFKVKTAFEHGSTCFFACHEGGTEVDFSYLKCMSNKVGMDIGKKPRQAPKGRNDRAGGRGFGRGGGRNMRGRGGRRGRGRGRGRGRA